MRFLVGLAFALLPAFAHADNISLKSVVLHGLDKVTGRLSTMTVDVGEKTTFGALDVYVRVCFTHPPEETPEHAAYLDIVENHPEGQTVPFSGWMFASSPALSAMDHPVYDIWVVKCQGNEIPVPKPKKLELENLLEKVPTVSKMRIQNTEVKEITDDEVKTLSEPEKVETPEESDEGKAVLVPLDTQEKEALLKDIPAEAKDEEKPLEDEIEEEIIIDELTGEPLTEQTEGEEAPVEVND